MLFSSARLEALAAVCDSGSFDQAALQLHVTPSALSQRISALEREVGQVLVQRSRPAEPTEAGRVVLGLARQTMLLHADALERLPASGPRRSAEWTQVPLAVNADSVATWYRSVLDDLASSRKRLLLDLRIEDQDHTAELLAKGEVMAAVTTSATPAPGCTVERLGTMSYWAACAPDLLGGTTPDEVDLGQLPMLRFNAKDDLQHAMLRQLGTTGEPPTHLVPSNAEFLTLTRLGLGWSMIPREQAEHDVTSGRLVRLFPDEAVDVELHWQRWRIQSSTLDELTAWTRSAAEAHLQR
jgi:LysR family transcriptional regulator (chromosome initiation inhibitor)